MATSTKGLVLKSDLNHWDGLTRTASRVDSTGGTISGERIGDAIDVLMVYGSGTNRTDGSISNLINAVGSNSVSALFSTGTWTISNSVTIPSNITCLIPAGCVFSVDAGKTLTFSGAVQRESDTWTTGSGTVTYTAGNNILVHYYDVTNTGLTSEVKFEVKDSNGTVVHAFTTVALP